MLLSRIEATQTQNGQSSITFIVIITYVTTARGVEPAQKNVEPQNLKQNHHHQQVTKFHFKFTEPRSRKEEKSKTRLQAAMVV